MIKSTSYEHPKNFVSIDKSVGLFPVIIPYKALDILDTLLLTSPDHHVSANDQRKGISIGNLVADIHLLGMQSRAKVLA
jgi:hypothetical protein